VFLHIPSIAQRGVVDEKLQVFALDRLIEADEVVDRVLGVVPAGRQRTSWMSSADGQHIFQGAPYWALPMGSTHAMPASAPSSSARTQLTPFECCSTSTR
jgi:hypothetical protein